MIKTVKKFLIPHTGNAHKPHLLRERSITVLFCLAFVLFCTSLGSSYLITKTDFGAAVLPAVLVDLTNEHRIANNGKALRVDKTLEQAAMMKAKDMATHQYFAHTSPTGVTPWHWFSRAGYPFVYAGENLAINFIQSSDVEKAWIDSPTHHANLISEKFTETGIATYEGIYQGRPTTYVVQLFGKRPSPTIASPLDTVAVVTPPGAEKKLDTPTAAVKGESIAVKQTVSGTDEPAPVLIVEEGTFAVAQNINETEGTDSIKRSRSEVPMYSTFAERMLVGHSSAVQYVYLALILLVYGVLILMIGIQLRLQHTKNVALAILLLCFLGILSYVNSSFIVSFV